jgi:hypothetical protein
MASQSYLSDIPRVSQMDVCPVGKASYTLNELNELFPNGMARDTLLPNPDTGRIDEKILETHIQTLENLGTTALKARPVMRVGTGESGRIETNMDGLVEQDKKLYDAMREEYCYYEQRYRYALRRFLELATSRVQADNAEAKTMLNVTVKLNQRLNAVIEIMNYLAQLRVGIANQNKDDINARNKQIQRNMEELQKVSGKLKDDNVIIQTQQEMMRYTQEKNNAVTNQISVWVALNVLALASVVYVYRT